MESPLVLPVLPAAAIFALRVMRAANRCMADSLPLLLSAYLRECRETARFVLLNTVNDCETLGWTLGWRALGATFPPTEDL
jgi:hypothetical protein